MKLLDTLVADEKIINKKLYSSVLIGIIKQKNIKRIKKKGFNRFQRVFFRNWNFFYRQLRYRYKRSIKL